MRGCLLAYLLPAPCKAATESERRLSLYQPIQRPHSRSSISALHDRPHRPMLALHCRMSHTRTVQSLSTASQRSLFTTVVLSYYSLSFSSLLLSAAAVSY